MGSQSASSNTDQRTIEVGLTADELVDCIAATREKMHELERQHRVIAARELRRLNEKLKDAWLSSDPREK